MWWYFYYWASFVLSLFVLPILIGYLEAADFTVKGRFVSSIRSNLPYYAMYVVLFIALVLFLYLTSVGKEIVQEGGGLVGVLMGINMTMGLCQLALTLGYGIVKIPIKVFQSTSLKSRYKYAVYKVSHHEDQILAILYEKKFSIQALLFLANNINISDEFSKYLDEILENIDDTLAKTNEQNLKTRNCRRVDVETELLEKYNNGYIDIPRLQDFCKLVKDGTYELRRQHKFKMEAIEQSMELKKILNSVV